MTQRDSYRTTAGRFLSDADIEAIGDDVATREFDHPQPTMTLAAESAALEADEVDRAEMLAVARLLASLNAPVGADEG